MYYLYVILLCYIYNVLLFIYYVLSIIIISITSSPKLIPTPGFLLPGYSLFSCVFLCFLPPGEILKSGVGITFGVPVLHDTTLFIINIYIYNILLVLAGILAFYYDIRIIIMNH